MDTPERKQIETAASKFEDSPVFNYINSLSPLKPVKAIAQTFSSYCLGSIPLVFNSPHAISLKESRFQRRYSSSDASNPDVPLKNVCADEGSVVVVEAGEPSSVKLQSEGLKSVIELSSAVNYDCGSPNLIVRSSSVDRRIGQEAPENGTGNGQSGEGSDVNACDWETLMPGNPDTLIFNSPNGMDTLKGLLNNPSEPVTEFSNTLAAELAQCNDNREFDVQMGGQIRCEEQARETFSQCGEAVLLGVEQTLGRFENVDPNGNVNINPGDGDNDRMEDFAAFCKSARNLDRGVRRRCLDFETAGAQRKNVNDNASPISGLFQHDEDFSVNEVQMGILRPCSDSSRRIFPGIGLHLNALPTSSNNHQIIENGILPSGTQITELNSENTSGQEGLDRNLASASVDIVSNGNRKRLLLSQDASQATVSLSIEEFNQSSPKKKRRKVENAGETEGCRRCNCKKSKCLKLYCECFAAGVYCIEPCSCQECFNKPVHEETVLSTRKQIESRNPLAFAPKVIRSADSMPDNIREESSKTPSSSRHKRGCNCKKSSCLKKYCECYQGGVGCSIGCRCEGCKNTFGRKDGSSAMIGAEGEADEEEVEASEKTLVLQKSEIHDDGGQNHGSGLLSRPLVSLPFPAMGKPPRSSFLGVSGLYGQSHARPSILRSEPKLEKTITMIHDDDEMPEILRESGSASGSVKTSSPNSKRVSMPTCHGGQIANRSGRKLILQSIPSFPSLTNHQ